MPLKKRYNYCTINNGNMGSINVNAKSATSKYGYGLWSVRMCVQSYVQDWHLIHSHCNQLINLYVASLSLSPFPIFVSFRLRAVNNATIYTEMLFKNRENNNENAEQALRIDIGSSGGGGGIAGGGGGGAAVTKLEPEKKINAAICTLSTAIMPSAGECLRCPTRAIALSKHI